MAMFLQTFLDFLYNFPFIDVLEIIDPTFYNHINRIGLKTIWISIMHWSTIGDAFLGSS